MQRRFFVLMLAFGALSAQTSQKKVEPGPVQPIPYSHKQHLALGLQCKECHQTADSSDEMVLPETAKCMACHRTIKKDSPSIQKLAEFNKEDQPVPWIRIYKLPDFVDFSHQVHLTRAKATCETCHGPVRERDVIARESDISMAGCMQCHRANNASTSCDYCHDER
jgi:Cytochrome c7 and related cytochrome c/Class III cytochrome C family